MTKCIYFFAALLPSICASNFFDTLYDQFFPAAELEDFTNSSSPSSPSRQLFRAYEDDKPTEVKITCGLDISAGVLAFGRLGTSLYFVQERCKHVKTSDERAGCSVAVSAVIANAAFAAAFLSSAAATCAKTLTSPPICAAASSEMVAALGIIALSAADFQLSCPAAVAESNNAINRLKEKVFLMKARSQTRPRRTAAEDDSPEEQNSSRVLSEGYYPHIRNLTQNLNAISVLPSTVGELRAAFSSSVLAKIKDDAKKDQTRQVTIADCVFTAPLIADFGMRAGLGISSAIKVCKPISSTEPHPLEKKLACEVDVTAVLAAMLLTATLISIVSAECPVDPNFKAACATDVIALIAGVEAALNLGGQMVLSCGAGA